MTPIEIYAVVVTFVAAALLFVATVAIGKALHRDERVEEKLKARALALAEKLAHKGFSLLPPLIRDCVLGDWDKLDHDIEHAEHIIGDPEKFRLDLKKIQDTMNKEDLESRKHGQHFLDGIVHQAAANGLTPSGYVKAPAHAAPAAPGAPEAPKAA
ncbi:MAG: hypothetical protein KGL39_34800 [Patescibacteria group bacterium]|nr:hypothetical protein [Patescibacteria group bacterium]